jgi:hypothetical protein
MKQTILFILLGLLYSCGSPKNQTNESTSMRKSKNPGWEEQWKEMKIEKGSEMPVGFANYMFRVHKAAFENRTKHNLDTVFEVGPDNIAGRTRAFMIDLQDPTRFLAGGISGGLWEGLYKGWWWLPMDPAHANHSVTFINQSELDPNIVYYSTGEPTGNSAGLDGVGVFKSTDGGYNFELLESTEFLYPRIWRVNASLKDTQTMFIAHVDGLSMSVNGGETVEDVLFSEITDIELRKDGSIFAAMHGEGVFYSPDGTSGSWTELGVSELPQSDIGRIEMTVSPSNPDIIYVAYERDEDNTLYGVYKSENGGNSWEEMQNPQFLGVTFNYTWYCLALQVHPADPDIVFIGSVGAAYSKDGCNTWKEISNYGHVDRHLFVFDPEDTLELYIASDGGIDVTYLGEEPYPYDGNLNEGFNITQFYSGSFHPTEDIVMGGTQDNGTLLQKPDNQFFKHVLGGDGAFNIIHPEDPEIGYASYQNGSVQRTYNLSAFQPSWHYIMSDLNDGDGIPGAYFINPLYMSEDNPDRLFFPTRNTIYISEDGGDSWNEMTTTIDRAYIVRSRKINGAGTVVFIGGAQGRFYRIDDLDAHTPGGETNLRFSVPPNIDDAYIRDIQIDPDDPSILYVSLSSYSDEPRIWKVTDALSSVPKWQSMSGDLPIGLAVNYMAISDTEPRVYFAATDYGLYSSSNEGETWVLESDIPTAPIFECKIRKSDQILYAYTHGRGIWKARVKTPVSANDVLTNDVDCVLSPNPTRGIMHLQFADAVDIERAFVYDFSGRRINIPLERTQASHYQLDVGHLSLAPYVLTVVDRQGGIWQEKFIKQ